jgi:hypothetical protein
MAQLKTFKYLGAMSVQAGKTYLSADMITKFPTATHTIIKTVGVEVSINGTDAFPITFDDTDAIATGKTYIFNINCIIAFGIYVA